MKFLLMILIKKILIKKFKKGQLNLGKSIRKCEKIFKKIYLIHMFWKNINNLVFFYKVDQNLSLREHEIVLEISVSW